MVWFGQEKLYDFFKFGFFFFFVFIEGVFFEFFQVFIDDYGVVCIGGELFEVGVKVQFFFVFKFDVRNGFFLMDGFQFFNNFVYLFVGFGKIENFVVVFFGEGENFSKNVDCFFKVCWSFDYCVFVVFDGFVDEFYEFFLVRFEVFVGKVFIYGKGF